MTQRQVSIMLANEDDVRFFSVYHICSIADGVVSEEFLYAEDAFSAYDAACRRGEYVTIEGTMKDGKIRVYEQNWMFNDVGVIVKKQEE